MSSRKNSCTHSKCSAGRSSTRLASPHGEMSVKSEKPSALSEKSIKTSGSPVARSTKTSNAKHTASQNGKSLPKSTSMEGISGSKTVATGKSKGSTKASNISDSVQDDKTNKIEAESIRSMASQSLSKRSMHKEGYIQTHSKVSSVVKGDRRHKIKGGYLLSAASDSASEVESGTEKSMAHSKKTRSTKHHHSCVH